MIYPVKNYLTEWNNTFGYEWGDRTSYGYHDGKDINDNGAGNSDLGKPLLAIANGEVVGLHEHSGQPNFGKHFYLQIYGAWGMRFVHYSHCNRIYVRLGQTVKEGERIADVGNSGTIYAHCHFAIKKQANGMDTIALNEFQLKEVWEDPIAFIERWMKPVDKLIPASRIRSITEGPGSDGDKLISIRSLLL